MFVLVFVLMLVAGFVVIVMVIVIRHAIADGATGRTAQAGTYGASGRAADATPHHLTAGCAKATANGGFGFFAILRAHCATCCTTDAGTDGSTGATANRLADHTAQSATQASAHGGIGGFPGKDRWCYGKSKCKYSNYFSHFVNLKGCTALESVRCEKCGQRAFQVHRRKSTHRAESSTACRVRCSAICSCQLCDSLPPELQIPMRTKPDFL
ncbi:hypothetical protein D3C76_994790 [compost metagenome]